MDSMEGSCEYEIVIGRQTGRSWKPQSTRGWLLSARCCGRKGSMVDERTGFRDDHQGEDRPAKVSLLNAQSSRADTAYMMSEKQIELQKDCVACLMSLVFQRMNDWLYWRACRE